MRCPFCGNEDTQVKDSRPTDDNAAIRRRRQCPNCGARFTTFERVQLRELTVVKTTGQREPFDRDKLMRSMQISLRKRPVDSDRLERVVNGIVRRLESSGESEIPTSVIGEMVMDALHGLDKVAYVRFASVYRNFREAKDFADVLGELSGEEEARLARLFVGGARRRIVGHLKDMDRNVDTEMTAVSETAYRDLSYAFSYWE